MDTVQVLAVSKQNQKQIRQNHKTNKIREDKISGRSRQRNQRRQIEDT
ncbi:hypothetical protein HHX47_DHR5001128, partial [Lentinula edodes]